jgi:FtsH-binding integral membrane protein
MESLGQNAPGPNWKKFEEQFRNQPLQSAVIAFLMGFLLSLAPIRYLIGLTFRLFIFALKPTLLIFGGWKLYEYATQRSLISGGKH